MNKIKYTIITVGVIGSLILGLCSCSNNQGEKLTGKIKAYTMEEGSGTAEVFMDITGLLVDGNSHVTDNVATVKNDLEMSKAISNETNALGYVSLGTLDEGVKTIKVDGIEANIDNIDSRSYPLQRNFNFVTRGNVSKEAIDFIDYVLSDKGQKIIAHQGYDPINDENTNSQYSQGKVSGKIVINGSSAMEPLIESLADEYMRLNDTITIKINSSDSAQGVEDLMDGKCDIGMVSRDLDGNEMKAGVTSQVIAVDGIAVIVNNNNGLNNISLEALKKIYTGDTLKWSKIQ